MEITHGTVDYRVSPTGVESEHPVFSWRIRAEENGALQQAYRILVKKQEEENTYPQRLWWDSGRVESSKSSGIRYEGPSLDPEAGYVWKVRVWMHGVQEVLESSDFYFETAISPEMWMGQWMGAGQEPDTVPLPVFRKEYKLCKEVKRARAYVTALGQYEFWVNGRRQGDSVLEPAWTDTEKSVCYEVYDITQELRTGENVVGFYLGNGLQRIRGERYAKFLTDKGEPGICMHITVWYTDGTRDAFGSGGDFQVKEGPIRYSCFYGGEDWDAAWDPGNFTMPGYQAEGWRRVVLIQPPKGKLVRRLSPSIRIQERLKPEAWRQVGEKRYVCDLGKNISGIVKIKVSGSRGDKVRVLPGELLGEDGGINQEFTGSPHYYEYTLSGREEEIFCPKFTYYGFRYVEVSGCTPKEVFGGEKDGPVLHSLSGRMLGADLEQTGSFCCGNQLWNRIHEIIVQAMRCNAQSVLTDCPHREKLGWLEETHLIGPSLLYNFHMYPLYEKILKDIREAQTQEGMIPNIAPEFTEFSQGFRESVEWGSAGILVPWYLYCTYKETGILEKQYDSMNRYMEYLHQKTVGGIIHDGLGDWCDFGPNPPFAQNTPVSLTATGMYYYDLTVMVRICSCLKDKERAGLYRKRMEETAQAFNREFYESMGQRYSTGSQTANSMALFLDLPKPENREGVLKFLLRDLEIRGYHMTGGDVGFPFLLRALSKYDRQDIIARIAENTDTPSYGYQVLHGATTLCEEWDGNTPGREKNSQNHFMLGSIEEWFFGGLGGINGFHCPRSEDEIGISPCFVRETDWVCAECQVPQGQVKTRWHREKGGVTLQVEIPVNARAVISIPILGNEKLCEEWVSQKGIRKVRTEGRYFRLFVGSGKYEFWVREEENETLV